MNAWAGTDQKLQANLKDGGAPALQTFVTLTLLFMFCLQLSGLLGLAFDPSRGT